MSTPPDFTQEASDRWQAILSEIHPGWMLYSMAACTNSMGACLIEIVCHTPEGEERYFIPYYDQSGVDADQIEQNDEAFCVMIAGATEAENFDWTPAYTQWHAS